MTINSDYDQEVFKWRFMLVLSIIMHAMLFSALFWVPGSGSRGLKPNEVAYEVNLADPPKSSPPRDRASLPANKKSVTSADNKQARRISAPSSKKNTVTVSKRTVDRNKQKPKNNQASSDQLLDKAISKIEKKVTTEKDADYLDKAIAELNKKVGSADDENKGSGASEGSLAMNMYKAQVYTMIKNQWAYSDALGSNYEAIVLIKIRKDGTVLETNFIKPSGNKIFDESVLKAIERTRSLPPLPPEYKGNYEEIEFTFNLKDLE